MSDRPICMCANSQNQMARTRGLLTENDRRVLAGEKGTENRRQQVRWEVRNRIQDEIPDDIEYLSKYEPDLLEELQEYVCEIDNNINS